jgi:predicted nuclease with TOPRIM domain
MPTPFVIDKYLSFLYCIAVDIVEKLDFIQEKVIKLNDEKFHLVQENIRLQGEVDRLNEEIAAIRESASQYIAERDIIKKRVECLIEMIGG